MCHSCKQHPSHIASCQRQHGIPSKKKQKNKKTKIQIRQHGSPSNLLKETKSKHVRKDKKNQAIKIVH